MHRGPARRQVLCFVFDSPATPLLDEALAAGRLPALAGVLARGQAVALADRQDVLTQPTWLTLLRGCELPAHGGFGDREVVPGTYRVADAPSAASARPPFYRHLGDAGVPCAVLSPYGAPLLAGLPGTQVTGWGTHDPFAARHGHRGSAPPEVLGELERLVGSRALRHDADPPRTPRQVRAYVAGMVRGCEQQARAALHVLERSPWGFALVAVSEPHQAGHWLWDGPGAPATADAAARREGLLRVYEATDRALGTLLAAVPAATTVLVASPFGMRPNPGLQEALPDVLDRGGFLVRHPPADRPARARALGAGRRVVRATVPPGLRPGLGRLAGRERLLAELADAGVDWAATSAFPIPGDTSGAVRLNPRGREPEGCCVAPGAEADRVLAELTRALEALRCADTGAPAVARVARYEELFAGAAPFGGPAELFVEWARIPRPRALRPEHGAELPLPAAGSIRAVNCSPGFLAGAGPGIAAAGPGRLADAPPTAGLTDLAATVLALLDVPQPPELTGRPVPALASAVCA